MVPRTTRWPLSQILERLEVRDVPSSNLPQSFTFAVGMDADDSFFAARSRVATFNPDGSSLSIPNLGSSFAPFGGFFGGIRTTMADFNGDGIPDLAVAMGPGTSSSGSSEVQIYDGRNGDIIFDRLPFDNFTGGLFVAAGDINNDGFADLIVTPDISGGPRVTIYSGISLFAAGVPLGLSGTVMANFFAIDDPNFRGGCRAASGDVNGDGSDDVVVSAGFGGGPRVSVWNGVSLAHQDYSASAHPVNDFFIFESTLTNGAYVAVGDVNGDGKADVIGGGGPGGGPRVLVVSSAVLLGSGAEAALNSPIANFFSGDSGNRGGIRVTSKNLDGDRFADILTGSGESDGNNVTAYQGNKLSSGGAAQPYFGENVFPGFSAGVFVG